MNEDEKGEKGKKVLKRLKFSFQILIVAYLAAMVWGIKEELFSEGIKIVISSGLIIGTLSYNYFLGEISSLLNKNPTLWVWISLGLPIYGPIYSYYKMKSLAKEKDWVK
jgi:hypothetical protein